MEEILESQSNENSRFNNTNSQQNAQSTQTSVENSSFQQKINTSEKNHDAFEENMQISTNFQCDFIEKVNISEQKKDPVSDFDCKSIGTNSLESNVFSSNDEDNLLFSRLFPGVSKETLEKDEKFKLFARSKDKSLSLCEIYADYLSFSQKMRDEVAIRVATAQNNRNSSPGALSAPKGDGNDYFSKEQVKKMSREQIARNYTKIRESQQKW
ncbi:MAG: hypothetical protein E7602_03750 [Ruminococcaceae bacterium]|nr:hypothetical protein [Oscillospiraceae bacterium]